MTKTHLNLRRSRGRFRPVPAASAAALVALLLAACQGAGPPDMHAPGQNAELLLRVADDTRQGGDPGTAVDLYRRAHELAPQDPQPLARLGAALLDLKSYTEAASAYRAAIALAPGDPQLHRGLATVLLALNQPAAALPELDLAAAKNGADARLYNAMGVAHDLIGRHDLAQQDYRDGLRLAPKNAGIKNNYGLSLALSGDYPAAAATLLEIAGSDEAPARYRLNLALVYGLAGDDRRAAEIARSALDEAAVRSNLGYYALLRGLDDKARAAAIMGGQVPGTAALKERAPMSGQAAAPAEAAPPAVAARPAAPEIVAAAPPPLAATPPVAVEPVKAAPEPSPPPPKPPVAAAVPSAAIEPVQAAADPPAPLAAAAPPQAAPAEHAETSPAAPTIEMQPVLDPAPTAKDAKPETAPSSGGFAVQLGSFAGEANARKLADELAAKGYEVSVVHNRGADGRDWYAVRAGGYDSAAAAAAAAKHMRAAEQLPAVVVHLHAPSQA